MSFFGEVRAIPEAVAESMRGVSWHPSLPGGFVAPALSELRLLELSHWTFDARSARGELVVHADVADEVVAIFAKIYEARFPIQSMQLIDAYAGDDERSMAANNTSAYNCRLVAGTERPSVHAQGRAIDINPVQNPFIVRGTVYPEAGEEYVNRDIARPGMLTEDSAVVHAFLDAGWTWGGLWREPLDYHHFEKQLG